MKNEAESKKSIYERFMKRPLDIILALGGLIVLGPVMLGLTFLIRWKLGSPVLFTQQRPGLGGQVFTMYKFRSMTDARDESGELLPSKQRLTGFGRKLRATSLDELPELFNILKGDMSLVGPRPLLMEYLDLYDKDEMRRHEVRPGLTGLAQVMGRNSLSWQERFAYDLRYVDQVTFSGDLKIMGKTLRKVIKKEGVSPEGGAVMERFKGSGTEQ